MRFLLISGNYAPLISPRAIRWRAIAECWAERDHHVDLVSMWHPGLARHETLGGIAVHRVGGTVFESLRHSIGTGDPHESDAVGSFAATGVRATAKWLHDRSWKKLYWPDYACMWYWPARRRALRLLDAGAYDGLISVSLPFTGHLVGLAVKKMYPRLTWLADMGDPFSFLRLAATNNHALYERLNYRVEGEVLATADRVSVTTAKTRDHYGARFPVAAQKLQVIPPLLPDSEFADGSTGVSRHRNPERKLNLAYIGTFYPGVREPDPLLDLVSGLIRTCPRLATRIELHVYGGTGAFAARFERQAKGAEIIHRHGPVSRERVATALADADVLVNLGNTTDFQLPSKLVEYAATGKPILNLCHSCNDSSLEFLRGYRLAFNLVVGNGDEHSRDLAELAAFLESSAGNRVSPDEVSRFIAPYRVASIAGSYLQLLSSKDTLGVAAA